MKKKPEPAEPIDIRKARLDECAGRVRDHARSGGRHVLEIGKVLTEAKALCKHGEWEAWLKDELGWEPRTARLYMRVWECFKTENFSDLNIDVSALFVLANSKTPAEVRVQALEAARWEKVSHAYAKTMARKEKKEAEKRAERLKELEREPTQEEKDAFDQQDRQEAAELFVDFQCEEIIETHERLTKSLKEIPSYHPDAPPGSEKKPDADRIAIECLAKGILALPVEKRQQELLKLRRAADCASQMSAIFRSLVSLSETGGKNAKVRSISAG